MSDIMDHGYDCTCPDCTRFRDWMTYPHKSGCACILCKARAYGQCAKSLKERVSEAYCEYIAAETDWINAITQSEKSVHWSATVALKQEWESLLAELRESEAKR